MRSAILIVTIVAPAMTGCYDSDTNSSGKWQATSTDNSKSTDARTENEIIPGVSIVEEPGDFTIKMPPPLSGQPDDSVPTIEVVVRIAKGDRYYVGERSVSKEEISEHLKEAATMFQTNTSTTVQRAVSDRSYGDSQDGLPGVSAAPASAFVAGLLRTPGDSSTGVCWPFWRAPVVTRGTRSAMPG
jgi:hypothetical protein